MFSLDEILIKINDYSGFEALFFLVNEKDKKKYCHSSHTTASGL